MSDDREWPIVILIEELKWFAAFIIVIVGVKLYYD